MLYHDFSQDICSIVQKKTSTLDEIILLNAPYKKSIELYIGDCFSETTQLLFFPCEYVEDKVYFSSLQERFPQIQIYDRTQYSLLEVLQMFASSQLGVGKRLHFCLPLQYYKIPYFCMEKKDKHKKLLFS